MREHILGSMPHDNAQRIVERVRQLSELSVDDGNAAQQEIVDAINDLFRKRMIKRPIPVPSINPLAA